MSTSKHTKAEPWIILPGTTVGGEVGTFDADFIIWSRDGVQSRPLSGLVDTGASFTQVPAGILDELGIVRRRTRRFSLADGTTRDLPVGVVDLEIGGETEPVVVIFGPDPEKVLLGAIALESFGLAADAKSRRLIPGELTL